MAEPMNSNIGSSSSSSSSSLGSHPGSHPLPTTTPRGRDLDEVSVASDFSIIQESLVETEVGTANTGRAMSTTSFLRSEDLQPSLRAQSCYGKVHFQNVRPTYFVDSDIPVSYVLAEGMSAKSTDRVALYRVGFNSPQDYLDYLWAAPPAPSHSPQQLPRTLVFKASNLPKEAGEFFQFCYVSHEGSIVGVSAPFQLQEVSAAREGGVVCGSLEEEDGMVVVRTTESDMQDSINQLTQDKEQLTAHLTTARQQMEEMSRNLEEKTQQLNMCQHHLQVLETKMKKETTEKCELMGRIGQVVEEKGHLEDRVKNLDRSVALLTQRSTTSESRVKQLEEEGGTLRQDHRELEATLGQCQTNLTAATDTLKVTKEELDAVRAERDKAAKDLEFWTASATSDLNEKNSLALKYSTVSEELGMKLKELEGCHKTIHTLEEGLKQTSLEMTEVKEKLQETEGRLESVEALKTTHKEREEVVRQDNTQLQSALTAAKEKVAQLEQEKEAAETIACDLSGRLQAAKAEYHTLALVNRRLAKKVKKLRKTSGTEEEGGVSGSINGDLSTSVSSQVSSWLHAEAEGEAGEGAAEAAVMFQSSSMASGSSCCSHNTQQLSEVVNRKMEDIVKELTLQITSLKMQLQTQHQTQQEAQQEAQHQTQQEAQHQTQQEAQQEAQHQTQQEAQQEAQPISDHEVEVEVDGETLTPPTPQSQEEEEEESQPLQPLQSQAAQVSSSAPVLYRNTFLPTAPTAPVFLPEGGGAAATDHMPAPRARYSLSPSTTTTTTTTAPQQEGMLPPPLLPETTPTALQAAVMSQFTPATQHLQATAPPMTGGHESDDDDFHSTSDSDDPPRGPPVMTPAPQEHPRLDSPRNTLLNCPLCSLCFPLGTLRLLEEHINSHLEHVCPVCSIAFQRNNQARFEEHVQGHFAEEEEEEVAAEDSPDDPSGPWGPSLRVATRILDID